MLYYYCKRRIKALEEKFYLLEVNIESSKYCITSKNIICKILNSKHKEYTIRIFDYLYIPYVECNCPDSTLKKNICKHIYWLSLKKIGENIEYLSPQILSAFVNRYYLPNSSMPGRNNICPICLESLNHNTQPVIRCIRGCDNSVHTKCWAKYYIISDNETCTKCVICRQSTMPRWLSYKAPTFN